MVSNRIDFLYADSCKTADKSADKQRFPGRTADFDYSKCTVDGCPDKCQGSKKTYGNTKQLATHMRRRRRNSKEIHHYADNDTTARFPVQVTPLLLDFILDRLDRM